MHDLGLISHIANEADFEATLNAVVQRMVANAPLSLKAIKALLLREMTYRDGIEHADVDALARAASSSEDAKEGKAARLAKRDPVFKGQ